MPDEDVTDLTFDELPDDGKGKKGRGKKKEKAPKKPKESKGDDEKTPKKKGGYGGVIILMLLVLFLLVGGFGAALFFDALGARTVVGGAINDPLVDLVIWLDPTFNSVADRMRADAALQERRFRDREEDMDERDTEIIARETTLDSREAQLIRRENDLDHREAQIQAMLERAIPLHRRDMTEEELEDMLALSNTYAQMSPDVAASIMVALHDPRDVAGLLYFMSERNRAAIMSEMEVHFAAHITEILLNH